MNDFVCCLTIEIGKYFTNILGVTQPIQMVMFILIWLSPAASVHYITLSNLIHIVTNNNNFISVNEFIQSVVMDLHRKRNNHNSTKESIYSSRVLHLGTF